MKSGKNRTPPAAGKPENRSDAALGEFPPHPMDDITVPLGIC